MPRPREAQACLVTYRAVCTGPEGIRSFAALHPWLGHPAGR